MIPYRYVKSPPKNSFGKANFLNAKIISGILVLAGFFFFLNAAYPLISYQLLVSPRFTSTLVSPSSESAIAQSFGFAQDESSGGVYTENDRSAQDNSSIASHLSDLGGNQESSPIAASQPAKTEANVLGTEIDLVDYTDAGNWFPTEETAFVETSNTSYLLSIPKLNIKSATVLVGMEDLKKSLIQYPGTAVPGKYGNTVVFGHSVLPQFFNPKNYLTIFSTLPTLKIGDQIILDYNQISYKYTVEQMIEVVPNDVSILAQRYDDSYLTLITCVPPGTYLRRLIVRARLNKI